MARMKGLNFLVTPPPAPTNRPTTGIPTPQPARPTTPIPPRAGVLGFAEHAARLLYYAQMRAMLVPHPLPFNYLHEVAQRQYMSMAQEMIGFFQTATSTPYSRG